MADELQLRGYQNYVEQFLLKIESALLTNTICQQFDETFHDWVE